MRATTFLLAATGALQLALGIPAAHALGPHKAERLLNRPQRPHGLKGRVTSITEQLIIGRSPAIRRVRDNVATAVLRAVESTISLGDTHHGASDPMGLRILVLGDRGTGKELVATAVAHSLTEERRRGDKKAKVPFEKVNCGALVETLVVSELFGYKKGAFTGATKDKLGRFERARGGVLFLDEIGDLVETAQAALLRAVGDTCEIEPIGGSVVSVPDVHIVAATNRHPKELRSDLLDRLDQEIIVVPPLRDRPEDIGPLVTHFAKQRRRYVRLTDEALAAAKTYRWPGNVRELKSMVEWSIYRGEGPKVMVDLPLLQDFLQTRWHNERTLVDTSPQGGAAIIETMEKKARNGGLPVKDARELIESWLAKITMESTGGKTAAAAAKIGVSLPTFRKYLAKGLGAHGSGSGQLPN